MLRAMGCDAAQGWQFSLPLNAAAATPAGAPAHLVPVRASARPRARSRRPAPRRARSGPASTRRAEPGCAGTAAWTRRAGRKAVSPPRDRP